MKSADNPPAFRSVATTAVHAGRTDFQTLGVHAPPLDLSTTYPIPELGEAVESLELLAAGAAAVPSPIYSRLYNPTVARFESALAALEGAEAAVAFGSGMAALTAALLAARAGEPGTTPRQHVVAVRPLYGGSDHLLTSGLLGFDVDFVRLEEIGAAVRPETALVIVETPANPTLDLVDLAAAARAAAPAPLLVDSTFATPVLQRPLAHGAALVLHSATKFLGGHGDVLAGAIATSEAWAARLRQVRILTGAVLHPLAAFLLHRSLPTLPARVRLAQEGATILAARLAAHPKVVAVRHPSLPGQDPLGLLGRQMDGPGSLIAFEVAGGFAAASRILGAVRLLTPAVSLGSTDSLIQHPAGLTHHVVAPEARAATGIGEGLLRLSV
ncbi:MAG TPA: PLP-dependent transferase, partial [Thermoanaerobaculia bacterium]|nr:PLP-dependent transferase [Thermoanaerobaculia bacterium]